MGEDPQVAAAVRSGSGTTFSAIIEPYRRELRVHCYRMLGSYTDAEDHTQDTFLRAWRARGQFEGRSTVRAWLYRIATNACVDTMRRPERRIRASSDRVPPSDIAWFQPFPDDLLDIADPADTPDAVVSGNEAISLAFLAAIQLLPPRQRAALLLRDVLGWSAVEVASLLETTVVSVNSSLQRARATMRESHQTGEFTPAGAPTADEVRLLGRYIEAHHRGDAGSIVELLRDDIRIAMPPDPIRYDGVAAAAGFFGEIFDPLAGYEFRLVATRANRQPAAANYLREPGQTEFRAFSIDVLNIANGHLVDITTFFVPNMFPLFGLPATWTASSDR